MWPSAILLGDSQTQRAWEDGGWAQKLADHFSRRVDLINRGFSGYNTRMVHTILPDILSRDQWSRAAIVCIFLGSNDASLPDTNPDQAVPVEEFGDNLLKIISFILNQGVTKDRIILVSPPPVLPQVFTDHLNQNPGPLLQNFKSSELTKAMAEECGAVAARLAVSFVDLFSHLVNPANHYDVATVLSDGLHLGKEGHNALFSLMLPQFEARLASGPKLMFPEWREFNNQNTKVSYKEWKSKNS